MVLRQLDALTSELVQKATSGDGAALNQIMTSLSRPFYNLALRMLQNHEDAEDATQECLIRVATKLSTYHGASRFSTWAWAVATRCVLDFQDGRARTAVLSVEIFSQDLADGLGLYAPNNPETEIYTAQVKLGCGRAMLQVLDGEHRLVYILCEILELDQAEAAVALGITHDALRKRLSRARSRIREVLCRNCGFIKETNPCRCKKRVVRAIALSRLESRDSIALDIGAVERQVRALDELSQAACFFRADPLTNASEKLLPHVRATLHIA